MKTTSSNPQSKPINQKRGPVTGNAGTPDKRSAFIAAKSSSGSERSALAQMVCDAVAARGRDMQSVRDPAVEPLKARLNVGRGPTRGNRS